MTDDWWEPLRRHLPADLDDSFWDSPPPEDEAPVTCEACGADLRESMYFCSPSCQSFWMQDLYGTRQDAARINAVTLEETRQRLRQDAEMYAQDPHTYAGLR